MPRMLLLTAGTNEAQPSHMANYVKAVKHVILLQIRLQVNPMHAVTRHKRANLETPDTQICKEIGPIPCHTLLQKGEILFVSN